MLISQTTIYLFIHYTYFRLSAKQRYIVFVRTELEANLIFIHRWYNDEPTMDKLYVCPIIETMTITSKVIITALVQRWYIVVLPSGNLKTMWQYGPTKPCFLGNEWTKMFLAPILHVLFSVLLLIFVKVTALSTRYTISWNCIDSRLYSIVYDFLTPLLCANSYPNWR